MLSESVFVESNRHPPAAAHQWGFPYPNETLPPVAR